MGENTIDVIGTAIRALEKISSIDKNYNLKEINSAFKMMLKEKHSNDYAKLKKECDDISRFDCTF